jgi:tetratricopeptide (TPR) repeat protein
MGLWLLLAAAYGVVVWIAGGLPLAPNPLRREPPPALAAERAGADAVKWRDRAGMEMKADSPQLAYEDFLQALSMAPYDAEALAGYVGAAASAGRLDAAEAYLRGRAAKADAAPLQVELSRVLSARGDVKGAVTVAQHAAALDPSNERALDQLVSALADDGNEAALEQLVRILTQSVRDRPVTMYGDMRLADMRGDFAQAAAFGSRLTAGGGDVENAARNFNLLGIAYASVGDHAAARRAFQASLRIAPRAPAVLMNLGSTELRSGHPSAAARRFSEALFLYPTLKPALNGLAEALEKQGNAKRAAAIRAIQ